MQWDTKQNYKNYIEERTVCDEIALSILREYENELFFSQSPCTLVSILFSQENVDILSRYGSEAYMSLSLINLICNSGCVS